MEFSDFAVIGFYAAAVLAIGAVVSRRQSGADDFLLGGRRVPTVLVLFSLVATELSAATFIGVPADSYQNLAWTYLQLGIGSILARLVLARWVIPLYHRQRVRTVYEFIGGRFGEGARRATAWTFLVGRVLASSVRLFIAALAFSVVLESGLVISIIGCGLIAAVYSTRGGIRAVIWTDALQGVVLLAGAAAVLSTIGSLMPGGFGGVFEWARGANAIDWLSFSGPAPLGESTSPGEWLRFLLSTSNAFLPAVVGGFFLTLATHSTDHDMVQRLLTAGSGKKGGVALALSGFVNVPVVVVFLAIGTGLAALHSAGLFEATEGKHALPEFVRSHMGSPWRGLVLAGLFAAAMSSLDSAICAIGATWSVDLARRQPEVDGGADPDLAKRSRLGTLFFAGVLIVGAIGFAIYRQHYPAPELSLVQVALSAMSVVYGALLGVFGCGFLTTRGKSTGAIVALAVGGAIGIVLFLQDALFGQKPIAWVWWIPICSVVSFAIAAWFPGEKERGDDAFGR